MKKISLIIISLFLTSCFFDKNNNEKITTSIQTLTGIIKENKVSTGEKIISNMVPQIETGVIINTGIENISNTVPLLKSEIKTNDLKQENIVKTNIEINSIKDNTNSNDESITKYVNDKIHYSKINYKPNDLVFLKGEYIVDTKGNQTLRKEANENLQLLAKDFFETFKVKLKVVSAFRSYEYQVGIKKGGCSDIFCAKAGYSEHQSGLAVDFFEATSQSEFLSKSDLKKYFEWLSKNAYKYGFNNSYKNGKNIDGYAVEPWHWRYLGLDFAKELQEGNMTYGQYYAKYGEKK